MENEVLAVYKQDVKGTTTLHRPIRMLFDEATGVRYLVDGAHAWYSHFHTEINFDGDHETTILTTVSTGHDARSEAVSFALRNIAAFEKRNRLLPHEYVKHAFLLLDMPFERDINSWATAVFNPKEQSALITNRE